MRQKPLRSTNWTDTRVLSDSNRQMDIIKFDYIYIISNIKYQLNVKHGMVGEKTTPYNCCGC